MVEAWAPKGRVTGLQSIPACIPNVEHFLVVASNVRYYFKYYYLEHSYSS